MTTNIEERHPPYVFLFKNNLRPMFISINLDNFRSTTLMFQLDSANNWLCVQISLMRAACSYIS